MKKGLVLVTLLAALGLASCGGKTAKDETSPVISGAANMSCAVNETIDLLKGVTAVDDVDGDVTEAIEITLMPSLTVTNGKVTPILDGDYEVKYAVTDKAGNEGTAFATLNVTPALAEKEVYKKFEFKDASTSGFSTFFFDEIPNQIEGTCGIVKGNYEIKATKVDGEAWHIKFENGKLATKPASDCKIKFSFTSTVAGKVKVEVGGVNNTEYDVVIGMNTIEHEFTAASEETYVGMQLGILEPFTINVSSVEITQTVGEDVYTDVTPDFKYNANGVAWGNFDGEGTVTSTENSTTINIKSTGGENGVWQTKLFVRPGYDLEANKTYKISVDLESKNSQSVFEICYNNGDVEKGIGALYGQSIAANEKKTISLIVKPEEAKDNLTLLFQLGQLDDTALGNTLTISNLKIEEVGGDKQQETSSIVFTPEGVETFNDPASAAGNLYISNGKLVYEMTKIGLTDWHNKMFVKSIELEADKIYTISFKAKADKNISCALFLNPLGKWDPRLSAQVNFTTTEQEFSFTVDKAFATKMEFELLWQFGSTENAALGNATIEFSELIIYAQDVQ